MKAVLVRIGVDQAYGGWNAPVDADGRFVYVPIPESVGTRFHRGLERRYAEVLPALESFCAARECDLRSDLKFPPGLLDRAVHFDPDFEHLTYGDDGARRGAGIAGMGGGDLLVFYAGLRPAYQCEHKLVYAMVGLYVVREVVAVQAVVAERRNENAHTRKFVFGPTDIVVRARSEVSGRLERCISIGERRAGAYRVTEDVLRAWGGLSVKGGFIQRSAVPPTFTDAGRFYEWFLGQGVRLLRRNN